MPLLIAQLDMSTNEPEFEELGSMDAGYSVVNNACWSCGEIALKQGSLYFPPGNNIYILTHPFRLRHDSVY